MHAGVYADFLSMVCVCVREEDHQMGDLGFDQTDQLNRNVWAPEEKDSTVCVVVTMNV